mmetsp:Transcript_12256/g.21962  ORF Transcript_12256/g.21962 Transcript_12256/m.21962 type:complete len:201 (+) Transcript_12256:1457-2059(+)
MMIRNQDFSLSTSALVHGFKRDADPDSELDPRFKSVGLVPSSTSSEPPPAPAPAPKSASEDTPVKPRATSASNHQLSTTTNKRSQNSICSTNASHTNRRPPAPLTAVPSPIPAPVRNPSPTSIEVRELTWELGLVIEDGWGDDDLSSSLTLLDGASPSLSSSTSCQDTMEWLMSPPRATAAMAAAGGAGGRRCKSSGLFS